MLELRVFAGPRPADALRRFTAATGRQPAPPAPWAYGPVVPDRPAERDPARRGGEHRRARCATPTRRCRPRRPRCTSFPAARTAAARQYELARTRQFHAAGLAHLAYFNPHLCAAYQPVYDEAVAAGALQRGRRRPADHLPGVRGRRGRRRASPSSRWRSSTSRRRGRVGALRAARARGRRPGQGRVHGGLRRVAPRRTRARPTARRRPRSTTATRATTTARSSGSSAALGRPLVRFQRSGLDRRRALLRERLGRRPDHRVGLRRPALGGHAGAHDRHERRGALGLGHRRLQLVRRRASG